MLLEHKKVVISGAGGAIDSVVAARTFAPQRQEPAAYSHQSV
jgi:hypothetical protein